MSSLAEAEREALFSNTKLAVLVRTTLVELGHPQPRTTLQTDNSTAHVYLPIALPQRPKNKWTCASTSYNTGTYRGHLVIIGGQGQQTWETTVRASSSVPPRQSTAADYDIPKIYRDVETCMHTQTSTIDTMARVG